MYTCTEMFTTPIICAKIHCMAWLPDPDGGGLLATGNTSSAVSVAIVNHELKQQLQQNVANSYKVCVLKPVLHSIVQPIRPQLQNVSHVSWSKKYQFLASCHGYNHVLIWDRHGNRVTNKPVVIIRDESQDSSRIVPAVTVKWAHSIPILLITYEDGIMKLVKVASETNSSQISVDNISFSDTLQDAYQNNAFYNDAEPSPDGEVKLRSSCWSHDDQVVYSAAENTAELVVTSVSERRVIARIPLDIRVEELFSWYSSTEGQQIIVHHPCAAATIVRVDEKYNKVDDKLILTPFTIGSTKMAVRDTDGLIAIGGSIPSLASNVVCIYHHTGSLMKRVEMPCEKFISSLCWVGESSISVATKNHVHNVSVSTSIPSLEFLASRCVTAAQRQHDVPKLPPNIRLNFDSSRRTLPKNTPRVFSDTESASQCTLRVVRGSNSVQEAQFMVAEVGGEAVALRAIKQTALMSLGVHYEIMLRNDCLRTDEEQLSLINKHSALGTAPSVLNCSYSENFTLALRMSNKQLSRGTTIVSSLGKSVLFYSIHYSEKRSLLTVQLHNGVTENDDHTSSSPYTEASGVIHRPVHYNGEDTSNSVVLVHQNSEVFQLLRWQKGNYSVRYKAPFSMCAAFCTAVNCISRKLI